MELNFDRGEGMTLHWWRHRFWVCFIHSCCHCNVTDVLAHFHASLLLTTIIFIAVLVRHVAHVTLTHFFNLLKLTGDVSPCPGPRPKDYFSSPCPCLSDLVLEVLIQGRGCWICLKYRPISLTCVASKIICTFIHVRGRQRTKHKRQDRLKQYTINNWHTQQND